MNQIYIRESRSEVLVVLDKHVPDRLSALKEACRILSVEVIREQSLTNRNANWDTDSNKL